MATVTATFIILGGCGKEGEVNGSTGDETGQDTGSSTASETNSDTGSDTSTDTEVTDLCTPDPCHGHGACEDSSGAVVCTCTGDYDPAGDCVACVSGKQDKDNNGSCLDTCTTAALTCSGHGTCSDTDGTAGCECTTGYMGDDCGECAGGYHPVGDDCVIDEDCGADSCNGKGTCTDTTGVVVCTCTGNYNPAGNCATCLAGYNNVATSDCIANVVCDADSCNGHGVCTDSTGVIVCDCSATDRIGDYCESCPAEKQDKDDNGSCTDTCAIHSPTDCGANGSCSDASGTAACVCTGSYDPAGGCSACLSGKQDSNDDGACLPDCATTDLTTTCAAAGHGSCTYNGTSGAAECSCSDGWSGAVCDAPPLPTVSIVGLDCSADGDFCIKPNTYPLVFTSTNADTFTGTETINCGIDGNFNPANGTVSGSPLSIDFTLGNCVGNITLQIEVCNISGCISDDVTIQTF
jgi:hypothetical protein